MLQTMLGNMPWSAVCARMERGQLPSPLWGVAASDKAARWDARAVNRALDRASAIPNSIEADTAALDRHFGIG
jgi:hypothetical protein